MQQDAVPTIPGGGNNAQAMSAMGFDHLIHNFDAVGWVVFITLVVMSVLSVYFIFFNLIRNMMVRSRMDRVIHTFWETPSAQEAIRFLEEQPKSEPFSKIALDAAVAAQHHTRHEGSRLVEALNRSEFIDRALRQGVARESMRLETGLTVLATVGSTAPFVGLLGTVGDHHPHQDQPPAARSMEAVAARSAGAIRPRSACSSPSRRARLQLLRAQQPPDLRPFRRIRA